MGDSERLLSVVRSVRNRWRLRRLLWGAAVLLFLAAVLAVLAGYVIDLSRFDGRVVSTVRILTYLAFAAGLARWVIWPLTRRVSDQRVALYLEENEPSLGGRLISALEVSSQGASPEGGASAALTRRLVESAIDACEGVEEGKRVERVGLWRSSGLVAGSTVCCLGVVLLGPAFLRHTTPVLLDPWKEAELANPYSIWVEPGDITLAKGSDLKVSARLEGFDAAEVELAVRPVGGDWTRWSMLGEGDSGEGNSHTLMVFDLTEKTEYFVSASGVRSAIHRVEVEELPYVDDIHLTYHFPAYTGLDPVEQPSSGDIAALVGTRVEVEITPTFAVPGGLLEIDGEEPVRLKVETAGRLRGSLVVGRETTYRVRLENARKSASAEAMSSEAVVASPDYLIDPLEDQPPLVVVTRPGRDTKASSLEEVLIEAKAQDDYGVSGLELVVSVGGGEEQVASLYRAGRREVVAAETLYLEEYGLQPGDLISYYARAVDGRASEAVSDIYFLEIRPFDRNYRQADQGGMPGGEGGMERGELASQQRLIVAATFKLSHREDSDFAGDITTIAMSQGRLRQQVEELRSRSSSGAILREDSVREDVIPEDSGREDSPEAIANRSMALAVEAMSRAEQALGEHDPKAAQAPARQALQELQRLEAAVRDVQVARGEQQGGAGGGGEISEELADLFEMDAERLKNQYEQVQRGRQEGVDNAIDETLEKLRELARRQQQENERMRARARQAEGGTRAGSSGRTQRELAEEAEEVARKLERLAREEKLPDLAETAQELRRAAEEMRRAAASGERSSEALGHSALDQLRQARRQLEKNKSGRLERDTRQALERTQNLRQEQERMIRRVDQLSPEQPGYQEALQRLMEAKERMGAEVGSLEGGLDQLARDFQREQAEASRRLKEAASGIRDGKIREKILYSRGVVQERSKGYAQNFEQNIAAELEDLEGRLRAAEGAIGEGPEQRLGQALEETREVVNALESLEERLGGSGAPGREAPDREVPEGRQVARELRERRGQLEGLGQRLRQEGVDGTDLERIIDRIRGLESGGELGPESVKVLADEIVRGLKEFEYGLRRSLTSDQDERLLEAHDGDVPEGYEEMVERYYKALAGGG